MKVLIVDNDMLVCRGLRKLIDWEEYGIDEVLEAHNGKEAYELCIANNPDLIISDISMPVMNGLELCEKVFQTMIDIPIILLSAYDKFEYAKVAMKYGVKNYILKPIDRVKIEELRGIIRGIIMQKHSQKGYLSVVCGEMQGRILEALKILDEKFFDDFFRGNIEELLIHNKEKRVVYIALVEILFKYFEEIGFIKSKLNISKDNTIDTLMQFQNTAAVKSYVEQLYLDVIQCASDKRDNKGKIIIEKVKKFIAQDYANPELSVSYLAEYFSISSSYLGCIFKNSEQVNISTYITIMRIEKACDLLGETNIKVKEVADLVGYRDPMYFAKVFKKIKGITPSEYQCLNL